MTKSSDTPGDYFANHDRRLGFPWSLYHRPVSTRIVEIVRNHGTAPSILIVGCGLEPYVPGVSNANCHACDVDDRVILTCKELFPQFSNRVAQCPSPYELPQETIFMGPFDLVIAKDVLEHLSDPVRWAQLLTERLKQGGELVLSTPNYGRDSTLNLIERTVLEIVARFDGYSRRHIHPSRFDKSRLANLDVGPDMSLVEVSATWNRWSLIGRWEKTGNRPNSAGRIQTG